MVYFAEMRPQWFDHSDIPYDKMWPDDYMWYPHMLNEMYIGAYMLFEGHDRILKSNLTVEDSPLVDPVPVP